MPTAPLAATDGSFNQHRFLAIMVLCGAGMGMTAPITVLFASSFGASPAVAGLTWSSLAISLLLVDVFGTTVVPRVDGRAMLSFALTVFGVGGLLSAVAPTLPTMIAARMVQGVGAAVFMGGALQLVVRFAPPGGAGRAIGTFNAACFTGIATGPLIGGGLASLGTGQFGFRLAFVVSGGVCLVAALAARVALPAIPSRRDPRLSLPDRPRARAGFRMWPPLSLGVFGQALRGGLEFTAIPLFGKNHLGLGTTTIGIGLSALAFVDIFTMRYGGMLGDRFSRRAVLCGALGVGVAGCAAAPLVSGPGGYVAWCAVMGVCVGAAWVVPAALVVDVASETEPALAAYRICGDLGEAVGPTAIGGLIGAVGSVEAMVAVGGVFASVGLWVGRLAEAKIAPTPPDVLDDTRHGRARASDALAASPLPSGGPGVIQQARVGRRRETSVWFGGPS